MLRRHFLSLLTAVWPAALVASRPCQPNTETQAIPDIAIPDTCIPE